MVDILEDLTKDNLYFLINAADANRKYPDEEICVCGNVFIADESAEIKLPNNLKICGWFHLATKLPYTLPDNMTVLGNMWLNDSSVEELPNNLIVEGYLNINGTKIKIFPKNLKVLGKIYVENYDYLSGMNPSFENIESVGHYQ